MQFTEEMFIVEKTYNNIDAKKINNTIQCTVMATTSQSLALHLRQSEVRS